MTDEVEEIEELERRDQEDPTFDPDWFRVAATQGSRTPIYLGTSTAATYVLNVLAPNNKSVVAVYVNDQKVTQLTQRRSIVEVEGLKIEVHSEHDFRITVQFKRTR